MRDLVLGPIILGIAAYGVMHPWIGVLGWTWISIMNPHSYAWRLDTLPVAALMAGSVMLGVLITRDKRQLVLTRETVVLMLFMAWMCLTLPFSFYLEDSFELWKRVMKIDFMILMALVVLHSKKHILLLAWVLVFSIGFYGVKGGLFTLATGGSFRVWGPSGSYIEGNNEIALALVMIIPLMRFLQMISSSMWVKWAFVVPIVLCAVAALGSQSRGALVAIVAMAITMWWRSDKKVIGMASMLAVSAAILSFMPVTWWDRMETIGTYQEDTSASGRINAWGMAWNLASNNFFGGGFMVSKPELFARYAADPFAVHAAHSIYFMVLGEHGFIGLFLFLLMWALVWGSAGGMRKQGSKNPQTQWLSHMGAMCQVSLAGYAAGGAFLSLSYYDLPYNILVLVVLGRRWMETKEWVEEEKQAANATAAAEAALAKSNKKRRLGVQ